MQSDPPTGVNAAPIEGNIMQWQAVIFGCVGVVQIMFICIVMNRVQRVLTRALAVGARRCTCVCKVDRLLVSCAGSPDDTPWEGGTFNLLLEFTEDYPNKAPTVRFVTKMFHPNST